jgi:hypothetical protein
MALYMSGSLCGYGMNPLELLSQPAVHEQEALARVPGSGRFLIPRHGHYANVALCALTYRLRPSRRLTFHPSEIPNCPDGLHMVPPVACRF